MTRITPFALPFFISSIMSSADHGAHALFMVYGQVLDETGASVNGADVVIESATDHRQLLSGKDGSFATDICVNGFCDEILVRALFGHLRGIERISAHPGHLAVAVVIRDVVK